MATSTWVYRLADGMYLRGGFSDQSFDPATEGVDHFPDANPHPDVRPPKGPGRQPRTPAEIAAYDAAQPETVRKADVADLRAHLDAMATGAPSLADVKLLAAKLRKVL